MKQIELTSQDEQITRIVNYDEIKNKLCEELEKFSDIVYTADSIAEAKNDRNRLNKIRASFERTLSILHIWRKNMTDKLSLDSVAAAEKDVQELIRMLDRPCMMIKEFIDYRSEELITKRKRDLMNYADAMVRELGEIGKLLISSEAFWEKRWDSQQLSLKKCKAQIKQKVMTASADINALKNQDDSSSLILKYIETFDLDKVYEHKKRLAKVSGVAFDAICDDNVTGYKVIRISGKVSDVERAVSHIELMGAEYELIEDGIPQKPTELREPDFNSFVAFDFETSGSMGINDLPSEIIEIGAVKVVDGKIVDRFSTLCDPQREITPTVSELTGITDEMVFGKPPVGEVVRRFCEFIGDFIIVGHGIKDSDMIYLERDAKREGIPLSNQYFDTYRFSKRNKDKFCLEGLALEALAKHFDVPQPNAHRALADAEVTVGVYEAIRMTYEDVKSP